jgi:hypothetical protein
MAEVFWINGFQTALANPPQALAALATWLESVRLRVNWVEQINLLTDEPGLTWDILLADSPFSKQQSSFCYQTQTMDEHLLLQQIIRRIRMDESASQVLLVEHAGVLSGALMMSHRLVGRYNLPPRLQLAETMAVVHGDMLATQLAGLPQLTDPGLYLSGNQAQLLQEVSNGIEGITCLPFPAESLPACLLNLQASEPIRKQMGLILSRQPDQPILVTSVQGL